MTKFNKLLLSLLLLGCYGLSAMEGPENEVDSPVHRFLEYWHHSGHYVLCDELINMMERAGLPVPERYLKRLKKLPLGPFAKYLYCKYCEDRASKLPGEIKPEALDLEETEALSLEPFSHVLAVSPLELVLREGSSFIGIYSKEMCDSIKFAEKFEKGHGSYTLDLLKIPVERVLDPLTREPVEAISTVYGSSRGHLWLDPRLAFWENRFFASLERGNFEEAARILEAMFRGGDVFLNQMYIHELGSVFSLYKEVNAKMREGISLQDALFQIFGSYEEAKRARETAD